MLCKLELNKNFSQILFSYKRLLKKKDFCVLKSFCPGVHVKKEKCQKSMLSTQCLHNDSINFKYERRMPRRGDVTMTSGVMQYKQTQNKFHRIVNPQIPYYFVFAVFDFWQRQTQAFRALIYAQFSAYLHQKLG